MTEKDVATAIATTTLAILTALARQGAINGEEALSDTATMIEAVRTEAGDTGPTNTILFELLTRLRSA